MEAERRMEAAGNLANDRQEASMKTERQWRRLVEEKGEWRPMKQEQQWPCQASTTLDYVVHRRIGGGTDGQICQLGWETVNIRGSSGG